MQGGTLIKKPSAPQTRMVANSLTHPCCLEGPICPAVMNEMGSFVNPPLVGICIPRKGVFRGISSNSLDHKNTGQIDARRTDP